MRNAFLEYLISHGIICAEEAEDLQTLLGQVQEPIGSIAFCFGMMASTDIDVILDHQAKEGASFGEVAKQLGILTQEQVDATVRVQHVRAMTEAAETLALTGLCSIEETLIHLARFLSQYANEPVAQPAQRHKTRRAG